MGAWLLINPVSGKVEGRYFSSHQDALPQGLLSLHAVFPIPHTHPAMSDYAEWEAPLLEVYGVSWGRRLQRREPKTENK